MISHQYRCVFVEIPKTGSTSIRNLVGSPPTAHLNICQIRYNLRNDWTHYGGVKNRLLASLYLLLPEEKRCQIGEQHFRSYFKFGFVRNPWDRFVSLYMRDSSAEMRSKMSFEEYVECVKYSSSTCVHPVPHVNQLDWLVDPDGNLMVDFVGRFESLERDWTTVADRLGISDKLPHKNARESAKKHYTEYYSENTRRIIQDRFSTDIEYFEYEFGD